MRNLKVLTLNVESDESLKDCSAFCLSTNNDSTYFVKNESIGIYPSDSHGRSTPLHVPLDAPIDGTIISVEYLFEQNLICIASTTGELSTLCESTHQLECVGSVSSGLKALSWSPDQDLLALVTGEDNLILMTKDFDPILEKFLHPDDFGENKPVTAGWGSKQTQFHGSEGKDARNKKQVVDPVAAWDDRAPLVTWRGDGQLFAISAINPQKDYRQIRIWDREGVLLCTSEDVNGLEGPISWKPSGSIIAGIQRLHDKHQVVFFEKNGLRHREFQLPFQPNEFQVNGLSWNSDSSVLAVWGRNLLSEDNSCQSDWKVMLWTTSNYHWFLKLTLECKTDGVSCLQWDVTDAYILRFLCGNSFLRYTLCWSTDRSQHAGTSQDPAFVGVVDGTSVKLTPFGKAVVPPPLCAYSLCLPAFVSQVVFSPPGQACSVLVVLSDKRIVQFSSNQDDSSAVENSKENSGCSVKLDMVGANGGKILIKPHHFETILSVEWDGNVSTMSCGRHWLWVDGHRLLCAVSHLSGGDSLFCLNLNKKTEEGTVLGKFCHHFHLPVYAVCIIEENSVAVELSDGSMFKYNLVAGILDPWKLKTGLHLKIPQASHFIQVCKIGADPHVLALSKKSRLFCDDKEILNNCTSFALHGDFLLLTTHSHSMRCLHLQHDLPRILSGQPLVALEDSPRSLERGSRLVTSVTSETRVVLQMPRGNLEVVHPRTLLLHTIADLLDRLHYKVAFQLMRKHRINLNLLYDHDPKAFMKNAEVFVQDVDDPHHINLFLAELSEEDVTEKMYSFAYRYVSRSREDDESGKSKVDAICDNLKSALISVDEKRFFLSVITTYAKKSTPELDMALQKIKEHGDFSSENRSEATEALNHLLYIVDVNRLYDIALGTYNFDIVLMVAEKSQKDPKEFLQFLNSLKALEPNYQKYKIDLHLRRYKKALAHIVNCGESHFEECLELISSQKLHRDALQMFPFGSSQNKRVWQLYGEYLMSKRQLEEAGLAFQRSGHWDQALSAHQGALLWEMAIYDAQQLAYGPLQLAMLAKSLAENLKVSGRHSEAACLLEQYAEDEEECIATLVDGKLWNAVLLKISKYKRLDLIETHLKPALVESADEMTSSVDQMFLDFSRHVQRLQTIRDGRQKSNMECPDEEEAHLPGREDAFSEMSSVTGMSQSSASNTVLSGSIATRRTSNRSRQKQELKKYSLKEGSRFEDLAIITLLSEQIRTVQDLRGNCSALLKTLVLFGFDKEATLLQKQMDRLLALIEKNLSCIWPPQDQVSSNKPLLVLGPQSTSNLIAAARMQQSRQDQHVISDSSLRTPPNFQKDADWKLFLLDK